MDKTMNRRNFLKLLTVAPLAPSVLATIPKTLPCSISTKTNEFGWQQGCVIIEPPLNDYHYVQFIYYDEIDSPATCEVFGSMDGNSYKRIGNCAIARRDIGVYEITIPEGVL